MADGVAPPSSVFTALRLDHIDVVCGKYMTNCRSEATSGAFLYRHGSCDASGSEDGAAGGVGGGGCAPGSASGSIKPVLSPYASSVSCWELRDIPSIRPAPISFTGRSLINKGSTGSSPTCEERLRRLRMVRDREKPMPKKAKWAIIVTAVVILAMSVVLVGITLRMAPLIDEMVRKENEDIMKVLTKGSAVSTANNHTDISHLSISSTSQSFHSTSSTPLSAASSTG